MGDPWAKVDESIITSVQSAEEIIATSFEDNFCQNLEEKKELFEPLPDSSTYLANLGLLLTTTIPIKHSKNDD